MGVELSLLLHDPPQDVIETVSAMEKGQLHKLTPVLDLPTPSTPTAGGGGGAFKSSLKRSGSGNSIGDVPSGGTQQNEDMHDDDKPITLSSQKVSRIEAWMASHKSFANLQDPQLDANLTKEEAQNMSGVGQSTHTDGSEEEVVALERSETDATFETEHPRQQSEESPGEGQQQQPDGGARDDEGTDRRLSVANIARVESKFDASAFEDDMQVEQQLDSSMVSSSDTNNTDRR
eukprot:PhM_4_TR10337/c0_g1_i1/m.36261